MKAGFPLCIFISLLLSTVESTGQITLTASDFYYNANDSVETIYVDTSGVLIPDSGANKIWNYTSLVDVKPVSYLATPNVSISSVSSYFPNANQLTTTSADDNFSRISLGKRESIGTYVKQGSPYIKKNTDPLVLFSFPLNYGDQNIDSSQSKIFKPGDSISFNTQKGLIKNRIIGYGELQLPNKTYPNVLLEKRILTEKITNSGNTLISTTYLFYAKNYYTPLLSISKLIVMGSQGSISFSSKAVNYFSHITHIGLNDIAKNNLDIYPIPTRDILNIKGIENATHYTLTNMSGIILKEGTLDENSAAIDIMNLPAEAYIIRLQSSTSTTTLKIVKEY